MFVEGEIEIKIKDRAAVSMDTHDLKIWVQQSFKGVACYRISNFSRTSDKLVTATVAIRTDAASPTEQKHLETTPQDFGSMRSHIERMFEGKGVIRALGEPRLRSS